MGPTALRSKPTIHNSALHTIYQSHQQQPPSSNDSHIISNLTARDDHRPRSPVSPLDSNGETWSYPRRANTPPKGPGTLYAIPLDDAPLRPRPMSFYDGMPTSPEPDPKAVFADLSAAPAKKRLSRPFEQPYAIDDRGLTPPGQGQAPAPPAIVRFPPMHAGMRGANAHLGRSAAQSAHRKAAPAPLAIPTPAHQPRRQREGSPYLEDHAPAEQRSARHQGNNHGAAQRPGRHEGWNPLEEPPRPQQRTAQDRRRGDDLEWHAGLARSKQRSKHDDPQYKSGRRCFFFLVIMMVVVVVIVVVTVKQYERQG
ncbi:MAG: hypothetical protein ASARMPREDX12_000630 [Alectoria sarmentosa]|nr:MAG: hypothetical protein ASARMPREDX12_000630 [Alectoria sarmentosa]